MAQRDSVDCGFSIAQSDDSSRLVRYLTKKGTNVDSSIKWKNFDHQRSEDVHANQGLCTPETMTNSDTSQSIKNELIDDDLMKLSGDNPPTLCLRHRDSDLFYSVAATMNSTMHTSSRSRESFSFPTSLNGYNQINSCQSIPSFSSLSSYSSLCKSRSLCLSTYTAATVTVLLIDIQGFTNQCASLPAARVGEWVAAFYSRVDKAAAAHGVQKVAVRGDCCICVAGLEGAVPFPVSRQMQAPDLRSNQATRMLAFSAALHSSLATLTSGSATPDQARIATATRMGMATGEMAFLVNAAAGSEEAPCTSVWGEVVETAALLEAKAAPGKVYVHRSTADRWAAEARQPPPHSALVECEGRGAERAAVYDCVARAFLSIPPSPLPAFDALRRTSEGALRQRASAFF